MKTLYALCFGLFLSVNGHAADVEKSLGESQTPTPQEHVQPSSEEATQMPITTETEHPSSEVEKDKAESKKSKKTSKDNAGGKNKNRGCTLF